MEGTKGSSINRTLSMQSHRTLGVAYDLNKVRRTIEANLNIEFQQQFRVGELQQINTPFGPIFTDGLQPIDPTDCARWPSSPYGNSEEKVYSDNWKVRTIEIVKDKLVSK